MGSIILILFLSGINYLLLKLFITNKRKSRLREYIETGCLLFFVVFMFSYCIMSKGLEALEHYKKIMSGDYIETTIPKSPEEKVKEKLVEKIKSEHINPESYTELESSIKFLEDKNAYVVKVKYHTKSKSGSIIVESISGNAYISGNSIYFTNLDRSIE